MVSPEGNGRTQRVFLSQLARHAGYVIDFARVDPDDLMIATIQAAGGVDDFLKVLFDEMLFFKRFEPCLTCMPNKGR